VKLEKTIEKTFVNHVTTSGGLALKFVSPGRRSVPDRLVLGPFGVSFFIEFKRPGENPTLAQQVEHNRYRRRGHVVLVTDSAEQAIRIYDSLVSEAWGELLDRTEGGRTRTKNVGGEDSNNPDGTPPTIL